MIIKLHVHVFNMILNLAILTFDSACCNNKLHMASLFTVVKVKEQITYKYTNQKLNVIFLAVKFYSEKKKSVLVFKFEYFAIFLYGTLLFMEVSIA